MLTERNSTKPRRGSQNLDLALSTLAGCRHSIEQLRDQEQILAMLRKVSVTLGLWESGLAEPAMRSARFAIDEMVADLEPKNPVA